MRSCLFEGWFLNVNRSAKKINRTVSLGVHNTAERNNSLDFLRIVAMGMIISMHYLGHGGIERAGVGYGSYCGAWLIKSFVSVGVNCYVLITGYF